jgi:hypothetical protein
MIIMPIKKSEEKTTIDEICYLWIQSQHPFKSFCSCASTQRNWFSATQKCEVEGHNWYCKIWSYGSCALLCNIIFDLRLSIASAKRTSATPDHPCMDIILYALFDALYASSIPTNGNSIVSMSHKRENWWTVLWMYVI